MSTQHLVMDYQSSLFAKVTILFELKGKGSNALPNLLNTETTQQDRVGACDS